MNNSADTLGVLSPSTVTELSEMIASARGAGIKLSTRRPGTESDATRTDVRFIDLSDMNAVVDYPARDMTITVQAGLAVETLTRILAEERQQLPIDTCDTSMSVGALVASDTAGPRQYGYGTLRDYVIGMEAVDGQGRVFHAGGRVVKNVAGYDLCRLMTGSRGSLGVLTSLTFKLKPLPEYSLARVFQFEHQSDFADSLERLNVSAATPVVLDCACDAASSNQAASQKGRFSLILVVEGTEASCLWQLEQLRTECCNAHEMECDSAPQWAMKHPGQDTGYGWKENDLRVRARPSELASVAIELAAQGYSSRGHAGNGILYVQHQSDSEAGRADCERIAVPHGGTVSQWAVDHPGKSPAPLSVRIRSTLDPHSLFE